MSLNSNVFLTFEEVVDWLKLKAETVGLGGGKLAKKIIGTNTYESKLPCLLGNEISIAYTSGATAGAEVVTVIDKAISVQIADGISTSLQIQNAVKAKAEANALVTVTGGDATPQSASAQVFLTGGENDSKYDSRLVRTLETIINTSCGSIETLIQTNVLEKEYIETRDGSGEENIVLGQFPIRSITELKISDGGIVSDASETVDVEGFFLRGTGDYKSASVKIIGQDIVLVSDGSSDVIGRREFSTRPASVRIKYKAGWAGTTLDSVPQDLRQAALLLTEYRYYQRENRDLGVTGKGMMGQNYTKLATGIPEDIKQLCSPFEDMSLGAF